MYRMKKWMFLAVIYLLVSGMSSCKKKNKDPEEVEFDKGAMLTNIADNIIIPSYSSFYDAITTLESDYLEFQANTDNAHLEIVRESWKDAYLSWQTVKVFNIGPAMNIGFKGAVGTFPSDTAQIESNIAAGSYDLTSLANAGAIGLSSLDYLLYGSDALNDFINNPAYKQYALDIIQKMKSETATVKDGWTSYRATFIASTGNETTSAFSQLVNEYNMDYEEAKNGKIGIPIGKQSLGIQLPEYIEARYSGFSLPLLRKSVVSLQNLFHGNAVSGASGSGFDDYLVALEKSSLSSSISANFSNIITKIDAFTGTLEEEMGTNVSGLDELYQLLAGQVVYLKTDMTSAFGILITYQDNDGD